MKEQPNRAPTCCRSLRHPSRSMHTAPWLPPPPPAAAAQHVSVPALLNLLLGKDSFKPCYEQALAQHTSLHQHLLRALLASLQSALQRLDVGGTGGLSGSAAGGQAGDSATAAMSNPRASLLAVAKAAGMMVHSALADQLSAVIESSRPAQVLEWAAATLRHMLSPAAAQWLGDIVHSPAYLTSLPQPARQRSGAQLKATAAQSFRQCPGAWCA